MKNLADTMVAIGMPLREDETISYILVGLGSDYDPLVTSLTTRSENLSLDDVPNCLTLTGMLILPPTKYQHTT